jgi:hypothetical protein
MSDALPPVTRADLDNARRALGLNHSSVHLPPPPRITTQEANAAHVAALEAENARLRRMLARVVDEYARDAWNERSTTRAEVDAWIAALAQDESCTG